ncbi:MAG: hypothetical protein WBB65_08145 [Anaerolineales bacterium]
MSESERAFDSRLREYATRLKTKKKGKWIVGVSLSVIMIVMLVILIERPRFLNVAIPSPISYLPNGDWGEKQYITKVFQGSYNREFILRKDSFAYGVADDRNFDSIEGVQEYFAQRIAEFGWDLIDGVFADECRFLFPEAPYLHSGSSLQEYVIGGGNPQDSQDRLCLVIIPEEWPQGMVFKVILVTRRLSPLTEFFQKFRDW